MVVAVVVMMAFIRIDSLLCLPSSKKLSNLAQRAQYLRLTIAGAPEISRHLSNLCTRWTCLLLGWTLSKKVFCWYFAHHFFGKPSLSNLAKGWVTILQKHFSEIQVWVWRKIFVPKQFISNQIFERPNIFSQFCSLKYNNYIFPIYRHWEVTVSVALSLICYGRDGTLLNITLKSKWHPPLILLFCLFFWISTLNGRFGRKRRQK